MGAINLAQPDITLYLDMKGVVKDVSLSKAMPEEGVEAWCGRPWSETVGDVGEEKIRRILEDARTIGVSAFRQINQRFPSGLEMPMEFTAVRLGDQGGLVAVGKNLQAVADLQTRLVTAQQAMERDYWKLREIETRYRLLFDSSNDAVLLVRASNLHIAEANPAAIRALGVSPVGQELLAELAPQEREPFREMLQRVREEGKAPAVLVHLGKDREPWLVKASLMTSGPGPMFLLQLSSADGLQSVGDHGSSASLEDIVERLPDAFVILDNRGTVLQANRAFLDLVQVASHRSVIGESLGRWLSRPGADLTVLLANIRKHGVVRLFSTTFHGALDAPTEVEISATGDSYPEPRFIGAVVRDVSRRLRSTNREREAAPSNGSLTNEVGSRPLRDLVQDAVGLLECHYIEAALGLTNGNRTAAAELLGLSRQGLYAKLNKYGLDAEGDTRAETGR